MTFHGRSNPGKNKCSIGYRHKQGKTFQFHKTDIEEAGKAADPDPDRADPDPYEPPPKKRNGLTIIGGPPEELWHGGKGGKSLLAAGCSG